MASEQPEKPKIFVDDNWKERVQAEKEALKQGGAKEQPADASTAPGAEKLPPASFPLLLTSMATQALAEMGQIPDASGKATVRLDLAKHVIDTLAVLEEKTRGNLTQEEQVMLTQLLHELRMTFVAVRQQLAAQVKAK